MTTLLPTLLPPVTVLSKQSPDDGLVRLVFDDGHGKSLLEVTALLKADSAVAGQMGCAQATSVCRPSTLADGTQVKYTRTGLESIVDTLHPDGRRVQVRLVNAASEGGPATRSQPALSPAELRKIALDQNWAG